ncbi:MULTISPECIES: ABC-ATPase domain-containing protein [unclassified Leptolyngbya]|uniref:ABC-ATPase domain-containing protein n=1 Tax=unclassified Leptolyngbya TaxID=2650499 RepID=UPI0016888380|nr:MULTISPECIES: ABC-ATPase domain-containing protein [unclassified Leptolyngbya]MBD1913325.1 ABC-ATPase domain-containing protein [Leptolyngbya sp. FACHB-8]MBD2155328.1 ABC-ATPase domain-containing protein [Leptolyngbya sp. FACHB-16]
MPTDADLNSQFIRLDGRSYKAYKDLQGRYQFKDFTLFIDYVQGDPFAAPSRLRVQVPQTQAQFPQDLYATPSRVIALCDFLHRQFAYQANRLQTNRGSGKSGLVAIAPIGQQVLERSSLWVSDLCVEARFVVGLPAQGRTILGRQAAELLCEDLPEIVMRSLIYSALDASILRRHIDVVEDADWLRQQLPSRNLVAFIPNGAILPRQSGVDDRPLQESAQPFRAPRELEVEFERPNQGPIRGMGIPEGITLIVGGGYHGKSTLLQAIALGIYNHIPGDGREQVVTVAEATKIRAEDGRSITGVDISPFINHLPQGRSTTHFSTENASGSTSQAASIMEALEAGATALLVDEDTSATNFMIRDRRMQALIAKDREPITPFIDKIQQLYQEYGVSTVLVMGGSGDYFDVADTVIAMTNYEPEAVTEQARAIAAEYTIHRTMEGGDRFGSLPSRIPVPLTQNWDDSRPPKLKVHEVDELVIGRESIDLSALDQLVDGGQLRAMGAAIALLRQDYFDGQQTLIEAIDQLLNTAQGNLDALAPNLQGDLTTFRKLDLVAAVSRMRSFTLTHS